MDGKKLENNMIYKDDINSKLIKQGRVMKNMSQ